jgi:GWxTD domain-containing protein
MRVRYSLPAHPGWCAPRAALAALFTLLLAAPAGAQVAFSPDFDTDVVSVRGEDGAPQLDVYTSLPYQSLRFLARTGGFEASYTVTVEVHRADARGRRQGVARTRAWERTVRAGTYPETQAADQADRALQSLPVEPGRYAVEVTVEDGASRRSTSREAVVEVGAADRPFALSSPLVLERYERGSRELHPAVGGVVRAGQDAFTLYYEIYAQRAGDLRVTYTATERARQQERPAVRQLLALSERQRAEHGVPYVLAERIEVRPGRNPATLRIDTERFNVGDYTVEVRLEDAAGALVGQVARPLSVRWNGLDTQIRDVNEAIAQLRYVARDREIAAMRSASTEAERLRLFQDFWTRRDPSPGTRRNERMEEYYYRVAYANERYGRLRDEGWSTDRGEVYIRFGEPDFVESHPFEYDSRPYEVWYYNRVGRRFIFVDDTGGGDYRLLVPIWDERTRM